MKPTPEKTQRSRTLADIFIGGADLLRPPERLSVSQAATKYRILRNPGAYQGPWLNEMVPPMVEPMDVLSARKKRALIYVGPIQTGKTDSLILNWIGHTVIVDPMDMLIINQSQAVARDFSARRLDRLQRDTPEVGERLLPGRDSNNVFDKHYKSGIIIKLAWPSVAELSGRPVPRVAITDYDRIDDDIGGEGSTFDLASRRTTSFMSFGMTLAESSPSREITDPTWVRSTPHEAPPTTGILSLYNRGDRRRLYWPCLSCSEYFEGEFRMLEWDDLPNPVDAGATVRMVCPHCGHKAKFDDRAEMLALDRMRWVQDGQTVDKRGTIHGPEVHSDIASFWQKGVAAAFVSWPQLVVKFLNATKEFERTAVPDSLVTFWNADIGVPYQTPVSDLVRLPEILKSRSSRRDGGTVPADVRFLVAAVDVQNSRFEVQVTGVAPGAPFDLHIIDRFAVFKSARRDVDGDLEWIKPGTYLEDWDLITEEVLGKMYPLEDDETRSMMVKLTVCDSGGREGVTTNAYNYQRKLRAAGLAGRFHLAKGDPGKAPWRTKIVYPDANRVDRHSGARGDVPLLLLSSNALKDALAHRLGSIAPGSGMIHWPEAMPDEFFAEMCAEVRTDKGWVNPSRRRNEAWDLTYYTLGACVSALLRAEDVQWDNPPLWAAAQDLNPLVVKTSGPSPFTTPAQPAYDFAQLGARLAGG